MNLAQLRKTVDACDRTIYLISRHATRRRRLFVGVFGISKNKPIDLTRPISREVEALANREMIDGGIELKSDGIDGMLDLAGKVGIALYGSSSAVDCRWLS